MTGVRIVTERLGGSALAELAQADAPPTSLFHPRPSGVDEWRKRVEEVRWETRDDWLSGLVDAFGSVPGAAGERLARVSADRGVVVTSGQQPGLFGGPMYTWTKAISALAFADVLQDATGIPTLPVFWAATDDSDLAEAAETVLAGPDGVERIGLDIQGVEGRRMADIPLPDTRALLERLGEACGSAADPRPLEITRKCWQPPATIGGAFVAMLRSVLEPLGIVVMDASHPAVSLAAHDVLLRALLEGDRVARALSRRSDRIRAGGYQPQVSEMDDLTLVFARRNGVRSRISRAHAAVQAATAERGTLSPNVLLRPVLERSLLPTVAYMAGPGELAYFAQVSAVAEALDLPRPLGLPRWSATFIEPYVAAVLERRDLAPDDFLEPHALETRLARDQWPAGVASALERLRRGLASALAEVRAEIQESGGLVSPPVLDGAARGLEWRIGRLERRINASVKRRSTDLMRELTVVRSSLFPLGIRQERVLNMVPMLSRHGMDLLTDMGTEARRHASRIIGVEPTVKQAQ